MKQKIESEKVTINIASASKVVLSASFLFINKIISFFIKDSEFLSSVYSALQGFENNISEKNVYVPVRAYHLASRQIRYKNTLLHTLKS